MQLDGLDITLILIGLFSIIYVIHAVCKEMRNKGNGSQQANAFAAFRKDDNTHKEYSTVDGLFGTKIHIDENGDYAGESIPGAFGSTMMHFDANDEYVGQSMPGVFEGQTYHVDADGNYAGTSSPGLFDGQTIHTDADGNYAGQSNQGLFGTTVHSGKNGESGVTSDGLFGSKVTDIDYHDDWQ